MGNYQEIEVELKPSRTNPNKTKMKKWLQRSLDDTNVNVGRNGISSFGVTSWNYWADNFKKEAVKNGYCGKAHIYDRDAPAQYTITVKPQKTKVKT